MNNDLPTLDPEALKKRKVEEFKQKLAQLMDEYQVDLTIPNAFIVVPRPEKKP